MIRLEKSRKPIYLQYWQLLLITLLLIVLLTIVFQAQYPAIGVPVITIQLITWAVLSGGQAISIGVDDTTVDASNICVIWQITMDVKKRSNFVNRYGSKYGEAMRSTFAFDTLKTAT